MYCGKCGNLISEDARFCKKCGNAVRVEKKEFNFWTIYIKVFSVTLLFFLVLFAVAGEVENDAAGVLIVSLVLSTLIGVIIAIIIKNLKQPYIPTPEETKKYKGLEGWLVLVILGLFISVGKLGYEFITIFNGEIDYSGIEGWLFYDAITMGGLTALAIYLIYLFFKKNKKFPKFYIIFRVSLMAINIITVVVLSSYNLEDGALDEHLKNAFRAVFGVIVWGLYIAKSKRVKATFVE